MQAVEGMKDKCKLLFCSVTTKSKIKFSRPTPTGIQNVAPGTVVDHSVFKPEAYEFLIVSTPTPTHYSVLVDEIQAGPEELQKLCYKLCYLYYNFSGAVKMPAPVKYSNRYGEHLAEHGACEVHPLLEKINGLFFI